MLGGGAVLAALERLFSGRDKPKYIEAELLGRYLPNDEVPMMYGVERTTEQSDHPPSGPGGVGRTDLIGPRGLGMESADVIAGFLHVLAVPQLPVSLHQLHQRPGNR